MEFRESDTVLIEQQEWVKHDLLRNFFGDDAGEFSFTIQDIDEENSIAILLYGPKFKIGIPLKSLVKVG